MTPKDPPALSETTLSKEEESASRSVDSWLKRAAVAPHLSSFQNLATDSLVTQLFEKGELGAYRLLEVLGQGGMGIVWRAQHQETGALVALKTLKFPKAKLSGFLRQEIRVLTKIRHPGIVRIVEEGVLEGLPYYAMELIRGQTLRQWSHSLPSSSQTSLPSSLSSWWTHVLAETQPVLSSSAPKDSTHAKKAGTEGDKLSPDKLETFLSVVRRLCETLSFLHGEGLVHRDLKPENILIRSNGLPVLVDFGIARPFVGQESSRERLSLEGSIFGTSEYMSPEQIERKPLDARSDLYSLGVILFELLTGQRPFSGKTPRDVLLAHLHEPVPSLAAFAPHLPQTLDTLVKRLLAKDPRQRLGYASDVTQVLAGLGVAPSPASLPTPRSYLYRPRFVGQHSLLATLREKVHLVETRKEGGIFLLGGESGVGKTRLVTKVAKEAAQKRIQLFSGECTDTPIQTPLAAFRGALLAVADRCREKGKKETQRLFGKNLKLLARYEPALATLPGAEASPEPADLPPQAARFRLFSALRKMLRVLAQETPLLLILDDLQWADELSLEFLLFLSREPAFPKEILLLGTYRTEEVDETLEKVLAQQSMVNHTVERLRQEDIAQLVGDMLALSPPPTRFSQFLYEQSEGNPFFVAELLRLAVEETLLFRDKTGRWQLKEANQEKKSTQTNYNQVGLPHSLHALIRRRLDGLSQEGRALVEIAAVLGREAGLSLLKDVSQHTLESLEELFQKQILESPSLHSVRFSHDKLREVALKHIEAERKQALHQRTATALETREESEFGRIGYHWEQALEKERATPYYLQGAKQAQEGFHHQAAEQLYRNYFRVAKSQAPSEESIGARNAFGEKVLRRQGKTEEAKEIYTLALQEAKSARLPRLEAKSLRLLGITSWRRGKMEEAIELSRQALHLARKIGDLEVEGRCLGDLAIIYRTQKPTEAIQLFEQALHILCKLGTPQLEGMYLGNLAGLYLQQGKITKAKHLFEQTLDIACEVKNRRSEGIHLGNLAIIHLNQGNVTEAKHLLAAALHIHRELGNKPSEGVCLGSLAYLYFLQGNVTKAKHLYQQAIEINRETENRAPLGICLLNFATLCLEQATLEKAKQLLAEALHIAREILDRRLEGVCLEKLGEQAQWEQGDKELVESFYAKGEQILREVNDSLSLGIFLCSKGHLLLWKKQSAKPLLEEAQDVRKEVGARPQSELGKKLSLLTNAQEEFTQKGPSSLFRGYRIQDIPRPLREFLLKTGQLPKKDKKFVTQ